MKKIVLLPLIAASTLVFNGCALVRTVNTEKINDISHKESAEIHAYGGERTEILGTVFFKQDGACSEVDFMKFVTTKIPNAQDLIRVRMEHHKDTKGDKVTEYCKYSGLAIAYKDISVEETAKWKALYSGTTATASESTNSTAGMNAVQFAPINANVQFVPANGSTPSASAQIQPVVASEPEESSSPLNFLSR